MEKRIDKAIKAGTIKWRSIFQGFHFCFHPINLSFRIDSSKEREKRGREKGIILRMSPPFFYLKKKKKAQRLSTGNKKKRKFKTAVRNDRSRRGKESKGGRKQKESPNNQ